MKILTKQLRYYFNDRSLEMYTCVYTQWLLNFFPFDKIDGNGREMMVTVFDKFSENIYPSTYGLFFIDSELQSKDGYKGGRKGSWLRKRSNYQSDNRRLIKKIKSYERDKTMQVVCIDFRQVAISPPPPPFPPL